MSKYQYDKSDEYVIITRQFIPRQCTSWAPSALPTYQGVPPRGIARDICWGRAKTVPASYFPLPIASSALGQSSPTRNVCKGARNCQYMRIYSWIRPFWYPRTLAGSPHMRNTFWQRCTGGRDLRIFGISIWVWCSDLFGSHGPTNQSSWLDIRSNWILPALIGSKGRWGFLFAFCIISRRWSCSSQLRFCWLRFSKISGRNIWTQWFFTFMGFLNPNLKFYRL